MGDTEPDGESGRCLHPKGAKVVTGARQTGVKDRNFEASAGDFGARNRTATGFWDGSLRKSTGQTPRRSGNLNVEGEFNRGMR
jgi:hypothetical protein